ncbi:MAG: PH domain-containing protein [Alphaproteobacteria bacterium]|nr:PH domain-containing protein [Alphaproteobacteria bacterium]
MEPFVPPSPRARALFHLQALSRLVLFWLPAVTIAGMVGAATWSFGGSVAVGGTFLFLQALLALWWPWLSFRALGWHLGPNELLVRRGVLVRQITAIPLSRIQHVDVRQGPLEQAFGLARLHVHTASGLGADGTIPGLEPEDAERLRQELTRSAKADDGV